MSRKPSSETTERLKLGKPHDSGQASSSSSSHVRSSVSFLNPDTVPGSTHLERAPSLNRLHAQSSTETSGLGETVTSGFSSQESVLSYIGDERDRSGASISFGDRSRRRAGGSPGSGRAVLDHELLTKEGIPNISSGLSFQHISKYQRQQDQFLTIPQPVQRVDRQNIQTRHDDNQRSKYDTHSVDNQQGTGRRQKPARDTGGRSLTPQEAKEEYEQRQRRIKQAQRKREAESYSAPQETRRSGPVLSSQDKQKPGSVHRQKEADHFDHSNVREHQVGNPSVEGKRRTSSSSSTRDLGDPDSKIEENRQSSRGDRLDGANASAGKSKQRSREAPTNRSIPRSSAKSSSRDSLELSSTSVPTSGSVRSDVTPKHRERSASDFNSSDHERRSSSKSREEIKTQSSSSSKSFDSQVSVIKPHNSKINSTGDASAGSSKFQDIDKPTLQDSGQSSSDKRRQRHYPSTSDLARSLPKLPDAQTGSGGKVSQRSLDEGKDQRGPHRNVHGPSKGSRTTDQFEARGEFSRQRSEHLETGNLSKEHREYERSKSWDKGDRVSATGGGKGVRYDEKHKEGEIESSVGSDNASKYGRVSARDTPGQVKVSDVQNVDLGPALNRRTDHNPRDTRVTASGAGERSGEGSRPKHSRERIVDPSEAVDRSRDKASYSSSHARQAQTERYDLDQGEPLQGRRPQHRVPEDGRTHRVPEEGRTHRVPEDGRTHRVPEEGRTHRVPEDGRSHRVPEDGRTHRIPEEGRTHRVPEDGRTHRVPEDGRIHRVPEDGRTHRVPEDGRTHRVPEDGRTHRVPEDGRTHRPRDGENVRGAREEEDNIMNYERLFQQASGGMNGTGGGGGSRTHPAALDGGYSTPHTRKVEAVHFGESYSNIPKSSKIQQPPTDVPSSVVAGYVANAQRQGAQAPPPARASYTQFQVPQTPTGPVITVKLTSPDQPGHKLENVDHEWERRDSRSSNKSHTSKVSGLFLGVTTSSAWAKWSRERRASYRRRIEKMEQAEEVPVDTARVSTPVKKARQEGLKFIHPDLEATYLSEDDLNELRRHKQQQVHVMRVIEKSRRHKFREKNEIKMTPEEWQLLQEFWSHTVFIKARFFGILVSLVAFIFMIVSITNHSWLKHSTWNLTIVEGLWMNCTQSSVIPNAEQACHVSSGRSFEGGLWESCYRNHSDSQAMAVCPDRMSSWQNAVIGLMIFAAALGFMASVLSICGVFTNPLPRKIYYFHSAGEVFFICALSASVALFVFPIAIEVETPIHSHRYGLGYGLGWVGTFFFFTAAVCLSLDDLVRESSRAKCCRWLWRGKYSDRNELRQV